MILVDTSVWVHHLRWGQENMRRMLNDGDVLVHPFVIGELSSGNLRNRRLLLDLLGNLPAAIMADHEEVLALVESKRLYGRGLGWIDLHLLASSLLSAVPLWSMDRRLAEAALSFRVGYVT